jgi:ribosomal protein S20
MKSIRATATATTPLTEEERKKLAVEAESTIAKAAAKGIMHKKNASRNISRMAQILRGKDLTETV